MPSIRTPKLRRQREQHTRDRAFVDLDGKRIHLGPWGEPATEEKYHRLIAEWKALGSVPSTTARSITVAEVIAAFKEHAEAYYRKPDGTQTSEYSCFQLALRPLRQLYGSLEAVKFGPKALQTVRDRMVEFGWCRNVVNKQINRIRHVFKWAVSRELIPEGVWMALTTVAGLKAGRTTARETEPKTPVPQEKIDAVRPFLSQQVQAVIDLQILTGARESELLNLRPIDLDTSGEVWQLRLTDHKTAHHGFARVIYFGPKAQKILEDFIANRPVDAYLFSPKEAERERHAKAEVHRREHQKPNKRQTSRRLGDRYTRYSYYCAIRRACMKAFPAPDGLSSEELREWRAKHNWNPHRLRHNAATNLERQFGEKVAQVICGHASARMTRHYIAKDIDGARDAMKRVG